MPKTEFNLSDNAASAYRLLSNSDDYINFASSSYGGSINHCEGSYSTILGGSNNAAYGQNAIIIGGTNNKVYGDNVVLIGCNNLVIHESDITIINGQVIRPTSTHAIRIKL